MSGRREFVLGLSALAFSTACGTEQARKNVLVPPSLVPQYNPRDHITTINGPFMQDLNKDPAYRAASMLLYNDTNMGHASLIEHLGKLYLYTVAHVARGVSGMTRGNQRPVFLHVPGVDFYQLDGAFDQKVRQGDVDPPAFYELTGGLLQRMQSEVQKKSLRPLTLLSRSPKVNERVAIARSDTGKYTIMMNSVIYTTGFDYRLFNSNLGVVCSGRSGGAVLRMGENGVITPEVYGVIKQGIPPIITDPENIFPGNCYTDAIMEIN